MTPRDRVKSLTAAFALTSMAAIAQVRDAPVQRPPDAPNTTTGTASIAGTVLTDADPPRPVRRASVLLSTPGTDGRTAVTDDAGRFVFAGLAAGRYSLTVMKRGSARMAYGATATGRPGKTILVTAGEGTTITMRMPRPGVITGKVLDEYGQTPAGVNIRVMQYRYDSGERRLSPASATTSGPDERGQYRVYGLAPGDYYVVAIGTRDIFAPGSDLHLTSDVDVQQAINAINGGPSVPVTSVPQRSVGAAPTYYPGTASIAQAIPVTVRSGEERTGVDFVTQYATTARIDGTITGLDGAPVAAGISVNLVANDANITSFGFESLRTSRADATGTFRFAGIAPGSYTLVARAGNPASWVQTEIDLQGDDIHGLTLAMQESLTVSGAIKFDGTAEPPAITAVRVLLQPLVSAGSVTISASTVATPDANGHFSISGVTPGRYRLTATLAGMRTPWSVRTSSLGGQESLDAVVDVRSSLSDGIITLTDQTWELSGHGAPDAFVILFSSNPAHWTYPSHRILFSRIGADGNFTIKNAAAGDYLIAIVTDVEPGQWQDPAYLQGLVPSATKVSIAEGEKKTVDLRHSGG